MKAKITKDEWTKVSWPYNQEVKTTTWAIKLGRGVIHLREEKDWPYTASFGPNSENSFRGCLHCMDIVDLAHAQQAVLSKVRRVVYS